MDIRALRYFQTVAECGSYSRGSELLRISQPAVSRTIRHLEAELDCKLFTRHGHGVSLTEAGRILLERSQLVLRQLEQAKQEIRSGGTGPSGVVTLAVPPAAGYYLVPALVERLSRDAPNVVLKVVGGFSGYINEWLIKDQVDLACVHDPVPQRGFKVTPLLREEVFVVGKAGSFPTEEPGLSIESLASLPLILPSRPNAWRRLLDNWVTPSGAWIQPKVEVDDHTIMRSLVKQGLGFSLLTMGAFIDDLNSGTVEARRLEPIAHWPLALITCQRTPNSEVLEIVVGHVRQVVRGLVTTGTWPGLIDG